MHAGRTVTHLPARRRAAEALALFALIMGTYQAVGRLQPSFTTLPWWATAWDEAIPFVPHAVWIYLGFYFGTFVITVMHLRAAAAFRAAVTGFLVNACLAVPLFLLWPAAYPRPTVDPALGLSETAVVLLQRHDPATNTFPSLHVANSILCATALRRAGSPAWRGSAVLAACVAGSVLLVKQHWLADVAGGIVCAAIATWVLHRVHRRLEGRHG